MGYNDLSETTRWYVRLVRALRRALRDGNGKLAEQLSELLDLWSKRL